MSAEQPSTESPTFSTRAWSPSWDELYDRCCELGIVGIEFRRPSAAELRALLREHDDRLSA